MLLGTILFAVLILVILLGIFIFRRISRSEKAKARLRNLKAKVFWNPIIRYLILNSLKLSMTAFVSFKVSGTGLADISTSIALLIILNISPIIFYKAMKQSEDKLSEEETKKVIGSIYMGKNINKVDHNAHLFPMAFFWRRTLFVAVTVFLFDWPSMQMAAHHVITVIMIALLVTDNTAYDSTSQKIIEVGSELLMHFTSIMLAQFGVRSYSAEQLEMIEVMTLVFFSSLILLNVIFIIYVSVNDCKESCRLKALEKQKKQFEEAMEERKKKNEKKTHKKKVKVAAPSVENLAIKLGSIQE